MTSAPDTAGGPDPLAQRTADASSVGRGASWAAAMALVFLSLFLMSMVLVPPHLDREVSTLRDRIQRILNPARELADRVELSQVRQMVALQSFLISGDGRFRQDYREAHREEDDAFGALMALTEEMPLLIKEKMARLSALSLSWHLNHQDMLTQEILPEDSVPRLLQEEYRSRISVEQQAYEEVVAATRDLKTALEAEAQEGESAMGRVRATRDRIMRVLVFLGLFATMVVVLLGWHLRTLMTESEARRQDALRARRETDALLRATGDGVLGIDSEGHCTFLNRAGAELLGYPRRLVEGRDVHDLLHHSRPDGTPLLRSDCAILGALDLGNAISARNETLWRAGRVPFPVQISLRPLRDGTELKGAVLTFTDMTETRAAEERLKKAVQARDEVLAVVSHDLRNPVGTVYSAASLLMEFELTPEKRREQHQAIKNSARRMNHLIQDLLDVARLEAGALTVSPIRFSVGELAREILETQRGRAETVGVALNVEVEEGVREGWGDRHRLVQVLTNLVDNALRFTPEGGRVDVTIGTQPDGGGLLFRVADNGPGIPPGDRERLFDRFWQVNRKDKRGAGLGLAIAKGFVEAHGGRIEVESEEGAGTVFWFTLPPGP